MTSSIAPFKLMDCALTIVSVGRSAQTLRELRDHLAVVPAQSLSHHFYDSLLRPSFDDREYRNDFALWARRKLRDIRLAERLAVIDPMDFADLEHLRQHMLDIVEDRLSEVVDSPPGAAGQELHFLTSQFVILDTGVMATTPAELAALIPRSMAGSIFYHFVDARRRSSERADDYSSWLKEWGAGCDEVRRRLSAVDFYLWPLTELRERIAHCFEGIAPRRVAR
jgi:Family of unknown function (DUF5752)